MQYDIILKKSSLKKKEYAAFFRILKKRIPSDLDLKVKEFHETAFKQIDCLLCANCCKSISPALYNKDIERISKILRMKPSDVAGAYLQQDEDNEEGPLSGDDADEEGLQ